MSYVDEVFMRADIQQIQNFLLYGVEAEIDPRSYVERLESSKKRWAAKLRERYLEQAERPIWRLLEKTFHTKKLDKAAEKLSCALVANQHVYMEIGMKAGAMIIFDLLQESLKHGNI